MPGAGKTLVGLDVAVKQSYQDGNEFIEDEGAVYLSGNGPLVAVLTEALAIDNQRKCRERGERKISLIQGEKWVSSYKLYIDIEIICWLK